MLDQARRHTAQFQTRLKDAGIDVAVMRQAGRIAGAMMHAAEGALAEGAPEYEAGDTTILKPGMTFAVDGGISVDGRLGGRSGDTIVVTETGNAYLTDYPREINVVDR